MRKRSVRRDWCDATFQVAKVTADEYWWYLITREERPVCSHKKHLNGHASSGWEIALLRVEKRADEILGAEGEGMFDLKADGVSWDQVGDKTMTWPLW